ncbi:hypothetical protein L1987_02848 [Smallanthus sonchifolius]|uniref:Uncharacterized protein n=1 Tax=Smallanthus sonchifolius TaxID=185202 RepID=A0ACB9K928_9ASTR|nr:hypothetical protein L1987_02848 [Smallanthus sonchifolius]
MVYVLKELEKLKKKKDKKRKSHDGGDDIDEGGDDDKGNGGKDEGEKKDDDLNDNPNQDEDLGKSLVVYEGEKASGGQPENDMIFYVEKDIEEGMEDAETLFHTLFHDHDQKKDTKSLEDELDPELAELFKDIDDEVSLPEKYIYVDTQREVITGIDYMMRLSRRRLSVPELNEPETKPFVNVLGEALAKKLYALKLIYQSKNFKHLY